jgi:hypothetical protein
MGILRFFHIKMPMPDPAQLRYPVAVGNRRHVVAFISIGSFFVIFLVAILWATRPVSKREAQEHGTKEQNESILQSR